MANRKLLLAQVRNGLYAHAGTHIRDGKVGGVIVCAERHSA